jgi:hypothetical protein
MNEFQEFIEKAARALQAEIELAIRGLMAAEGLTEQDLAERCVQVAWPDGRVQITLDGVPRIEWSLSPSPAVPSQTDAAQEE